MTDQEYIKDVLNFIYKMIDKRDKIAYYNGKWVIYGRRYVSAITLTDIIPFVEFYSLMMKIDISLTTKKELIIFTGMDGYTIDEFVEILFPKGT